MYVGYASFPVDKPTKGDGGVFAVPGGHVPDTPYASEIAASGDRIAVVPATMGSEDSSPNPGGPVLVYTLFTGKLVTSAPVNGTPLVISLSSRVLAVLVKSRSGLRIDRFDPGSGAPKGSTTVPGTVSPALSVSGNTIVYPDGRKIWLLDAVTGKRSLLATAAATPVDLSISGRRVAWGENLAGRGRIVALDR